MFLRNSRSKIKTDFQLLKEQFPSLLNEVDNRLKDYNEEVSYAIMSLYTMMPLSDMSNYSFETFLDYAENGVFLWNNIDWIKEMPEEIFINYVLHHRINEEEIHACRRTFRDILSKKITQKSIEAAAIEVNYWCAQEVRYKGSDDRTLSALSVYRNGYGRCGEESTFCINALRSIGIPARQVYVPRWSHCDDNHAWVEIWCDGEWKFTGACEPMMILNKGWFCDASSRAMLVHSRVFGSDGVSDEDIIGTEGMVMLLNQLNRYAKTKRITVIVKDKYGCPVPNAKVEFQVLNMSSYYTIAEILTDNKGEAKLLTGLGSLYLHVSKDEIYSEALINTKDGSVFDIHLEDKKPVCKEWIDLDIIAPDGTDINNNKPTQSQLDLGKEKLKYADNLYQRKINNCINKEKDLFLKKDSGTEKIRLDMMSTLSEKDHTDCISEILEEHLEYALKYERVIPRKLFVPYILSPRIDSEVITKYRAYINRTFDKWQQQAFIDNPSSIWDWIEHNICEYPLLERTSIYTTPSACLKYRIGSFKSKKILFVAICRTLGIPARLNQMDSSIEYWKDDQFISVLSENEKSCTLVLNEETGTEWKYFQNWTIARLVSGTYETLTLDNLKWINNSLILKIPEGRYRIITSNRLPNGNIFARQKEFEVYHNQKHEELITLRHFEMKDLLINIPIPELYFLKNKEKNNIIIWLEEGSEPTEHILNEMISEKESLKRVPSKISFIVKGKDSLENKKLDEVLKIFPEISVYYDDFKENLELLSRRLYANNDKLPFIIVTDSNGSAIYTSRGYNVGTISLLINIINNTTN